MAHDIKPIGRTQQPWHGVKTVVDGTEFTSGVDLLAWLLTTTAKTEREILFKGHSMVITERLACSNALTDIPPANAGLSIKEEGRGD